MDQSSSKFTSAGLSSVYDSYYRETQIKNWTPVEITITTSSGEQFRRPPCKEIRDFEACVELEERWVNGKREQLTEFGTKQMPIEAERVVIPLSSIRNHPYKVPKYNVIISTADQECIAREMLNESNYNPILHETRVDDSIMDPRLVFQVMDPGNRWDVLFVNVFGQTIALRAGHWNQMLPVEDLGEESKTNATGSLICYLRYPDEYCQGARPLSTVFEISLDTIDEEEPLLLPDGQTICVAATREALQRVLAKKATGFAGRLAANMVSSKMVPKELHETMIKEYEGKLKAQRDELQTKMDSVITLKNNEVAKLKTQLAEAEIKVTALESQVARWEQINKAESVIGANKLTEIEALAKARQAQLDASRKEIDNMWNVLKVSGGIVATVLTFAVTLMAKRK